MNAATPKARVSVTRLFNLGNFEHLKMDVSIEVPPNEIGEFLHLLELKLNELDPTPPCDDYALDDARQWMEMPGNLRMEHAKEHGFCNSNDEADVAIWVSEKTAKSVNVIHQFDAWQANRHDAFQALNRLGASISPPVV
jgi:hypothetical protein